ncbi:glycolate oxidase subunit GlcE [Polynucleobacter sp. Latsch14-2]|jgi:glycolate oxidase FAD binding subunit|uniref:glycolate oxidase subunit GlcE n=1 Tax=Polynucleobacter sp. Latsch14-2 TaxID=2576920 RepID=UPI001C0D5B43|nr:glycolate oxidase subunit GlcE [Polynucleobacter sp. Latsch14-2]MBU3613587.1 glycolate oxidase subunit GlcE [Polynucleobacter sp. Latsch14-2]
MLHQPNPNIDLFREQILQAAKTGEPLSIEGGGTKSWYGNHNAFTKLNTRPYSGILEYQPEELVITACAGTPLTVIEAALAENNQVLAFEPPSFNSSATFGGVIAAGLAGPGRISAGNLRDFVLGARIMDGKGQDLSFGGQVMKNVAGYDVSRLIPGSMGTLALLLEASVKVLPKPAATATLRCQISQAHAHQLLNEWAGQPLPLSASCWIGAANSEEYGELTIRLSGAIAAVHAAIPLMNASINAAELEPDLAHTFWSNLREQKLNPLTNLAPEETLYRLALPAACGPLRLPNMSNEIALEWHGQQRWWKGPSDNATFAAIKALANANGGHAARFRQGANVDPAQERFTKLSEQAHSQALESVQARLRAAFDPAGVFATNRLP